jgi:NADP-dependent 3-hydroxy acid dehydrogenase YdfG
MQNAGLAGRVALVTGASSGIGEGAALALGAAGATVVVAARRVDRLAELVARIEAAGGTAFPLALDVTDAGQITSGIAAIEARYGRLDCVVNSAGVMLSAKIADANPADWRTMIDINLLGSMNVTQAALPLMKAGGSGHVFMISSIGARLANVGSPGYSASKAGLGAFTESLRKETALAGIRVTLILPGLVETELFEHLTDEATRARFGNMLKSLTPLSPADLGNAIVYTFGQPQHVSINELVIRPTAQPE